MTVLQNTQLNGQKKSRKRVVLYTRVSTQMQVQDGLSLDSQLSDMQKFCEQKHWQIVNTFTDEGESGRLQDRPGLQNLLYTVRQGEVDVVIVYSLSRFYRKLKHLLSAIKLLRDHNVAFISITENMDFSKPWGKLVLHILGTLAEIYVDELSANTSRGKEERAVQGKFNGSIPYGYCNGLCSNCTDLNGEGYCPNFKSVSIGTGKVPVPHPIDKFGVQLAFKWAATGKYSDADIAYKLNEFELQLDGKSYKFRPKRPELRKAKLREYTVPRIFVKSSIREILKRKFYLGLIEYRGGHGIAEERKKFKKAKSIHQGKHEAIISQDIFDKTHVARRRRGKRAQSVSTTTKTMRVYPLSRVLYSHPPNNKMRAVSNGSGVRFYRDRANIGKSKLDQASRSPQPMVEADILEKQVLEVMALLCLPPEWKERIVAYLVSPDYGISEIMRKKRDIYIRFERTKTLFSTGAYDSEQYRAEKSHLKTELSQLMRLPNSENTQVSALLNNIPSFIELMTASEVKDIIETLFQKIYVENEDIVKLIVHPAFSNIITDSPIHIVDPQSEISDETLTD